MLKINYKLLILVSKLRQKINIYNLYLKNQHLLNYAKWIRKKFKK